MTLVSNATRPVLTIGRIENSEPNLRKGWGSAIRSSRLNDAGARANSRPSRRRLSIPFYSIHSGAAVGAHGE
jgi:hypothetical protein